MNTKHEITLEGYGTGMALAIELIKDIPKIGEMFPESLYSICSVNQIPTDAPVDENTDLEEIFLAHCYESEQNARQYVDFDAKRYNDLEEVSEFGVWEAYEDGLSQAWDDLWTEQNPRKVSDLDPAI